MQFDIDIVLVKFATNSNYFSDDVSRKLKFLLKKNPDPILSFVGTKYFKGKPFEPLISFFSAIELRWKLSFI